MAGFFIGEKPVGKSCQRNNIALSFCIIKLVCRWPGLLPLKKWPARIDKSGGAKTQ